MHCFPFTGFSRFQAGFCYCDRSVTVPCSRSIYDASLRVVDPALEFNIICINKAISPILQNIKTALCFLTNNYLCGIRQTDSSLFADYFALNIISILTMQKSFYIDNDTGFRLKYDDLRIFLPVFHILRYTWLNNFCGYDIII